MSTITKIKKVKWLKQTVLECSPENDKTGWSK